MSTTMTEEAIQAEFKKIPQMDDQAFVDFAKKENLLSDEAYENFIDRLDVSDKLKVFLRSLIQMTKKICNSVIKVGKVVLNIIIEGVRRLPHAVGGAVIGLVIGMLLSAIPVLGMFLGPVVTPILAAGGGLLGFAIDVSDSVVYGLRDAVGQYMSVR